MRGNSRRLAAAVAAVIALTMVSVFQNCAQKLPSEATDQAQLSPPPVPPAPLQLIITAASIETSTTLQLSSAGGVPPYTFSVLSGPAGVNMTSGLVTAGSVAGTVWLRVTDSKGTQTDGSLSVTAPPPTGGGGGPPPITPGSVAFESSGDFNFTVPNYGRLTVVVNGGGGGGGGANVDASPGSPGGGGGNSVFLGMTAEGGAGGQASNYYAGINFYGSTVPAQPGNGIGGGSSVTGGGAGGGAPGTYALTQGQYGGRGGQVSTVYVIGSGGPSIGDVISFHVGGGGAGGKNGGIFPTAGSGGNGSVYIYWDP
ncbi:MAG: hypothetical protein KF799_10065 [Bdellovibrionales bacterium]|nr:hypothetical protein [Bdellovibrionales bacterium]